MEKDNKANDLDIREKRFDTVAAVDWDRKGGKGVGSMSEAVEGAIMESRQRAC